MDDDEFVRMYEAYERESIEEFIEHGDATKAELQDAISFLIHRRELLRDCALEELEHESEQLIAKLSDTKRRVLLEELGCFRDILKLHRQLIEDDEPRD